MSDNPFDQFDATDTPASASNPFDQFDGHPSEEKLAALKPKNGAIGDSLGNEAHAMASGMYHGAVGGYRGIGKLITGQGVDAAADAVNDETSRAYQAPDSVVKSMIESKYNPLNYAQEGADYLADKSADAGWSPGISTVIKSAPTALMAATGLIGLARNPRLSVGRSAPMRPNAVPDAPASPNSLAPEEVVSKAAAAQSMGAASTPMDLTGVTPQLRQKISSTDPDALNLEALERHRRAETLPLPDGVKPIALPKGLATRDSNQASIEYNMRDDPDTGGLIRQNIDDNSKGLGQSIGEIQRRATPDVVGRTTPEHDQTAIDAIKSQDNDMIKQNRTSYKELADAHGGTLPIDKGALGESLDSELDHEYLTDTVNESKILRPIMADIRSPKPLTFQRFESIRTRLAEVMRDGSSDGAAARIVRSQLETMPLTDEAAGLKGLADKARSGAKARFDWIDENPAVEAAVNDNVPKKNGLHVIGAKSPQAGGFLDRFATGNTQNASAAYVDRLKQSVPNPDLHDAIEGATLNKLRDSAGIDPLGEGTFKIAPFSKTVTKLGDKAPLLMKPETLGNINHLKAVADDLGWEGAASGKNRSNTGSMLANFGALPTALPEIPSIGSSIAHTVGEHVLGNIPGGKYVYAAGDFMMSRRTKAKADAAKAAAEQSVKDAKLKFASDAVAPGAGIDTQPPTAPVARATGGRTGISDDELVERLMRKWRSAKRQTDESTKPLLRVPDAAIIHALKVSGALL
jgi:hypothetical protein